MPQDLTGVLEKRLTANDLGVAGSHQAGFVVPRDLVAYLPSLDEDSPNPDAWIHVSCPQLDDGWRWRFIHYNNRLFTPTGTRDEYRITRATEFLRASNAMVNDVVRMTRKGEFEYTVELVRSCARPPEAPGSRWSSGNPGTGVWSGYDRLSGSARIRKHRPCASLQQSKSPVAPVADPCVPLRDIECDRRHTPAANSHPPPLRPIGSRAPALTGDALPTDSASVPCAKSRSCRIRPRRPEESRLDRLSPESAGRTGEPVS